MDDMRDRWGSETRASRIDQFEPTAPAPLITGMGSKFYRQDDKLDRHQMDYGAGLTRVIVLALVLATIAAAFEMA
jgi:hypothetical protein